MNKSLEIMKKKFNFSNINRIEALFVSYLSVMSKLKSKTIYIFILFNNSFIEIKKNNNKSSCSRYWKMFLKNLP